MDPLSLVGGVVSGAASLLGGANNNAQSAKNIQQQFQDNMALQTQAQFFNSQQADIARQFAQQQGTYQWDRSQTAASTAFDRSEQMVEQQRAYETQMSNTAYQRQVADMKAAGLNPIMAAGGGGGASTPQISAPGVSPAVAPSVNGPSASSGASSVSAAQTRDVISPAVSSALQGFRLNSELKQIRAQTANVDQDTENKASQLDVIDENVRQAKNQTEASKRLPAEADARIAATLAGGDAQTANALFTRTQNQQRQEYGTGDATNASTIGQLAKNAFGQNPAVPLGQGGSVGNSTVYGKLKTPDVLNISPPSSFGIGGSLFGIGNMN